MKVFIYDCEVFRYDFIFIVKEYKGDFVCVVHNDNDAVAEFLKNNRDVFGGFNNKHYDSYIVSAIVNGATPEQIKDINDFIIEKDGNGWEHPFIQQNRFYFNNFDLKDDTQDGVSLKGFEAHDGMNIEESEVDFNIDRPLTHEEVQSTIEYCKFDIIATERLLEVRKDYLKTKIDLGRRAGIPSEKALSYTNAKLTAVMLHAKRRNWTDGRDYVYPKNLDLSVIPQKVLDFFDTIHDKSIPDEKLFKTYVEVDIGGMTCKYAWGGAHGSLQAYQEESTGTRVIQNRDVSSLYPSIIELYQYLSRNVPDPQLFYDIRKERITAKSNGDKHTAKILKLPLNTVSGAQESRFNDLYDPLPTRSLRISGQLFITMLTVKILNGCKTIKLLNLNTDGLMYSIDKSELPIVDAICREWEQATGFELEVDDIAKVWIKDVNNLLFVKTDGSVKTVGSYLNYGISEKSGWTINNNFTIVKKAVVDYFVKGIPVNKTINACNTIFEFQIIAKSSGLFENVIHVVNGDKIPVQKCNRVYATADRRYGSIYHTNKKSKQVNKITNIPLHCVIDNRNELTIDAVDKGWYINLAEMYVNDYLGVPRKKQDKRKLANIKKKINKILEVSQNMATKTQKQEETMCEITQNDVKSMNIHERLLYARVLFSKGDVKKTGKHLKPNYMYFKLDDIVPAAIEIFAKCRILFHITFSETKAIGTVINIDKPEETIVFESPIKEISAIESSSTGGKLTNPMQDLGSVETYARRYLYLLVLDVVEHDNIDGNEDEYESEQAPTIDLAPPKVKHLPLSADERKNVVKTLTNTEGKATAEQLAALKTACAKWREVDPTCDESIQKIAMETNGFTDTTKELCETLLINVGAAIESVETSTSEQTEGENV